MHVVTGYIVARFTKKRNDNDCAELLPLQHHTIPILLNDQEFPGHSSDMRKPKKIQNGELVVVVVAEHGLATTMLKLHIT